MDLRAEAEIAIAIGTDGAIGGYGAAIELVDVGRPPSSAVEGIVAGNIFHRAFVLGASQPARPSGDARLVIGGTVRGVAPVGSDFEATVDHVARHLAAVGEGLEPGDVIIAGALAHAAVAPGDEVVVEIGDLDPLRVTIEG